MITCNLEMQIQIHYVQNEAKLVEINLKLEQVESLPGHFDIKFVFDVLCHLSILEPRHVVHRLQNNYVIAVLRAECF